MKSNRLRIAAAIALIAANCTAFAQNYPARTIRMVIPFAAGGNTDIIGRIFIPKMAEIIGQQIIIDNRGGAGSIIGTEAVMRAAPDGYTLLLASAAHTINPAMVKKLPYDSIKDFTTAGRCRRCAHGLCASPVAATENRQGIRRACQITAQ